MNSILRRSALITGLCMFAAAVAGILSTTVSAGTGNPVGSCLAMLRRIFCLLVFALIAPAIAAAEGNETRIANPANLEQARILAIPSYSYDELISELFDAQYKCRKADFDAVKTKLLEQLDINKAIAERELEAAAIRLGVARLQEQPQSEAVKNEIGRSQYERDEMENRLRRLAPLRDFIESLEYSECQTQRPDHQQARARAMA